MVVGLDDGELVGAVDGVVAGVVEGEVVGVVTGVVAGVVEGEVVGFDVSGVVGAAAHPETITVRDTTRASTQVQTDRRVDILSQPPFQSERCARWLLDIDDY